MATLFVVSQTENEPVLTHRQGLQQQGHLGKRTALGRKRMGLQTLISEQSKLAIIMLAGHAKAHTVWF